MITRALEDYKMITSGSNQAAPAASDFASERSEAKSLGEGRADREASDFTSERFEGKTAEAAGLVRRGLGFRLGTVRGKVGVCWGSQEFQSSDRPDWEG